MCRVTLCGGGGRRPSVDGHARFPPPHNIQMLSSSRRTASFGWKRALAVARDARLHETAPHHLDVRGGVAVGCGDLCVAEPGLDRQEIDARPEELHGERVPEDVR